MGDAPRTLTVVLADTTPTYMAIVHENEHRPYTRRTVHIELTEGQRQALEPRSRGIINGVPQYEIVLECWLEPEEESARAQEPKP